jgi:hypothetical protein
VARRRVNSHGGAVGRLADLEPLAAAAVRHGRPEFLTVLAPLPLHGATSSPINPLAIF